MLSVLLFLAVVVNINCQIPPASRVPIRNYPGVPYQYFDESPKPYAFSYNAPLEDGVGQSSRTETADGSGKVEGSYSVTNDEGHTRVVDYIADQYGFRASIRTNEPGTDNQNPADVVIQSTAPYSNTPYNYAGIRRPVRPLLNPAVAPIVAIEPEAPENIIPPVVRPTVYRPPIIRGRNPVRPAPRYPYRPY